MPDFRLRILVAAAALSVVGALGVTLPAAAGTGAATRPPPHSSNEGPAGPTARMPNGRVATPPQVTSPQVSSGCAAAPYGANSARTRRLSRPWCWRRGTGVI